MVLVKCVNFSAIQQEEPSRVPEGLYVSSMKISVNILWNEAVRSHHQYFIPENQNQEKKLLKKICFLYEKMSQIVLG